VDLEDKISLKPKKKKGVKKKEEAPVEQEK